MTSKEELKESIQKINELIKEGLVEDKDDEYWQDIGARILILVDQVVKNSLIVNFLIPKVYSKTNPCLLDLIFPVTEKMRTVNQPFGCDLWTKYIKNGKEDATHHCETANQDNGKLSFYELAYSRFCSIVCQLLGDRFPCVQKLLIKHIFGESYVCSFLASDIYTFMVRIIHPHRKMGMVQLIMNICRLAPPEAFVKGAALINRIKHPIVNFEHANYQYLLDLS